MIFMYNIVIFTINKYIFQSKSIFAYCENIFSDQ